MELINNPHLTNFWREHKSIKLLYGGRDSSKTKDTALYLVALASNCGIRVMCARQFQNRIEQSVYTEIKWAIERLGVESIFTVLNNSIICNRTGSEFFFYGIRRNLSDIKGTADIDILWIEEGEDLTKEQFELIEPTVRKDGSMIIILFNPFLVTDYVWSNLVLSQREDILRQHINYNNNPFLSDKSKKRIENMKRDDYDSYLHIYEGEPKQDDNDSIIKRKWLNACVDAHIKLGIDPTGNKQIGYDVADDGEDLNAYVMVNGCLLEEVNSWRGAEDELYESSQKVYVKAIENNAWVVYDANGVGAGCGSNFKQMNLKSRRSVWYEGFDSAGGVYDPNKLYKISGADTQMKNKDYFENIKAQAWWEFADRCKDTYRAVVHGDKVDVDNIICISPEVNDLQKLITELSTPRKKKSGRLRNMTEKKTDLKKRGIKSPNLADATIMAFTRLYKKRGTIGRISKPKGI